MLTHIERLSRLCTKFGGSLVQVDVIQVEIQSPFDFAVGADFDQKIVYYKAGADPGSIIHEMGHVFASKEKPDNSEEFDFFGWEYAVAKQVHVLDIWIKNNRDYGLGTWPANQEFGRLSNREREEVLWERTAFAEQIGLIVQGRPIAIR